ncbi:STAS domain-containing protein [Delftia acidovorans]|uniref:STAS domain-containing protein n=1 Tax=Delftia acidovorans TaxID=80866 RepID=UPI002FDD69E7
MTGIIQQTLQNDIDALIHDWMVQASVGDSTLGKNAEKEARGIINAIVGAFACGADPQRFSDEGWNPARRLLAELSRTRAAQGQRAGETSQFILSLKKPLFEHIQRGLSGDPAAAIQEIWSATVLVDNMAQHTVSSFQQAREEIITRQQEELLELSTPVVKLWEGVLAIPLIGTLDSNRTQVVMESLLQSLVSTESELAIIDITGVPTVDTLVAQHLLRTVTAIRLMGAECIISGIRPQIAQTIVHLGIDMRDITTKATLAEALKLAMGKTGWRITRQTQE